MAAIDDILAAVPDLQALIASVGETISLVPKGVLRNPARPAEGYLPGTPIAAQAAVTAFLAREIDGKTIREGDRRVTMLAADITGTTPTTSDQITIESQEHRIISVAQIRAGGNPIAFELQVRA